MFVMTLKIGRIRKPSETLDKVSNFAKIKTVNSPRAYFIGTGLLL